MYLNTKINVLKNYTHKNLNTCLCVLEIMPPQWSNFVLSTNIPHCETYIFVLNSLNIETYEHQLYFNS